MRARIQKIFSDSGSEENIVDSREEFVPVDLEADLSDSDNNIFIFIIGICATSRIKLFLKLCLDSSRFGVATEKGIWHDTMDYLSHIPSFLKMCVYCIMHSSLFTTVYFKRAKTMPLQELSTSFCGVLNELRMFSHWECGECDG